MKAKSKTVSSDFSLDPQGLLHKKIKDHGKEFTALIVHKSLQKYVLFKSHTNLGHNSTTRPYQYLNRQCY